MLGFLNSRLSLTWRVALVAACAAPPIGLLLFLFVGQTVREVRVKDLELEGAASIAEVWPLVVSRGAIAPGGAGPGTRAPERQIAAREQAFAAVPDIDKPAAGAALIQDIADRSSLTLDSALGSFYAMDAATVALPRLMAVAWALDAKTDPRERTFALGQAQLLRDAAVRDLNQIISHDETLGARRALGTAPGRLSAALDAVNADPADPGRRSALVAEIDRTWRADHAQLVRLLQTRRAQIYRRLMSNLALIALTLGAAATLAVVTTRGLATRLRTLMLTLDRLKAGDTTAPVPFQSDRNETGRIASTLQAFKLGMIRAEAERARAEESDAAVRESEARLRILTENMSDIVIRNDRAGRRVFVSPSVRRFGYEPEDLIGGEGFATAHPDDRPIIDSLIERIERGERPPGDLSIEVRLMTGTGDWVWIEGKPNPVYGPDGELTEIIWLLRDIQARKAAERSILESEARYRMLADNASDIIAHQSRDFKILYLSPSVRRYGIDPEDHVGAATLDFLHPDDHERILRRRQDALDGKSVKPAEVRIRFGNGDYIWFESTSTFVMGEDGEATGFVTTLRDISERKAADFERARTENLYRILADNASDIIVHQSLDFRILYLSPSAQRYGIDPEAYIGKATIDFVHPDDQAMAHARRLDALAGLPVKPVEGRIRSENGDWIWIESILAPVIGEDGAITGFITTLRDIRERKAAEQDLVHSEARYRMLADNSTDIILLYNLESRIEYVSPSVRQLGYQPEDFIGRPAGFFVHPEDRARIESRRAALLRGESAGVIEARIQRADGHWVWIESNPAPIYDSQGRVTGLLVAMRDISQRKIADQALIDSEARYRMLADNSKDIIFRYGPDARTDYVSPSVSQLGYTPEEFQTLPHGSVVHPDDWPLIQDRNAEILRGAPGRTIEARSRHADGHWVWLESSPAPIRNDAGEVIGIVSVLRDISERKIAEAALQEVNAELARIARTSALGAFAASIAHEVNQPLAAAVIDGETALRWLNAPEPNPERAMRAINRATENARRASDVVGRLRAMVVREQPRRAEFELNKAIGEVLSLSSRETRRSNILLHSALAQEDPIVLGDRIQIQQVILNLVSNAIDAVREAPETQRMIRVHSLLLDDGEVEVAVEDRGAGIEPDSARRIFDNLYSTKIGGTGLGLPISKAIVEAHGGRIWVEDAEPHGAVFRVRLPKLETSDRFDG